MSAWTVDQVVALAPDASSASAGQGLASIKKWSAIGKSERAIWGLCQGSGKEPYQSRIDISEPAFKCSCPSRKFPCKHGLGLFLLFVKDESAFKTLAEPGWVSEWIAGRAERAEKKVERAKAVAEKPVDEAAQAKRAAEREARVKEGVAGCRMWLEDVMRRGLAAARTEPSTLWDRMAARMVDAQAPGLAGMVRRIPELIASGPGWDVRVLDHLGKLHLLLKASERLDTLPPDLAEDARIAMGWQRSKDEVLSFAGVQDRWAVLGQIVEEEERLKVRRTWLVGRQSKRRALVLDFAAGLAPLEQSVAAGSEFDSELAFYPGRLPLRALVKSRGESLRLSDDLGDAADQTIEAALHRYAQALAANPWTVRWPMVLSQVRPAQNEGRWHLVDREASALPLQPSFASGLAWWRLVATGGGREMTVLAEWDGRWAMPLSVLVDGHFYDLATRWAS